MLIERLRLEPIGPHHVDDLFRVHQDDAVAHWYGPYSFAEVQQLAAKIGTDWTTKAVGKWMVYHRETDELVGRGGLSRMDPDAAIARQIQSTLSAGWAETPSPSGTIKSLVR